MNFRKHISILLAFFLLVSNLGLALNVHYCDNEIASVSLSTLSASQKAEEDCCGVVEKDSKCCDNKVIRAEVKSDRIIVNSLSFDASYVTVDVDWNSPIFTSDFQFKTREKTAYCCEANGPPLYLLYSQYTFYS